MRLAKENFNKRMEEVYCGSIVRLVISEIVGDR